MCIRDSREDIPALAQHFLDLATRRMGREPMTLTIAQARALQGYDWPGNIRELQNIIDRSVILAAGRRARLDGLLPATTGPLPSPRAAAPVAFMTEPEMRQKERANLIAALRHAGGKVSGRGGAAELLGVKPSTLSSRIKALGLSLIHI